MNITKPSLVLRQSFMATQNSLPFCQKIYLKNPKRQALDLTFLMLLLSFLVYRLSALNSHGPTWLVALTCESWFTFIWVLTVLIKWNPMNYKTNPEHLLQRIHDLPPVDIFVTAADPILEHGTLSLLAVDYPSNKLTCYVSDDGCLPLTFYSLVEASKFAKLWVPFCKKYGVHVRAPFRYFCSDPHEYCGEFSLQFQQECGKMKEEYEPLCRKVEEIVQNSACYDQNASEFAVFSNLERNNHPTIIKVVLENKEGNSHELPDLGYVREKSIHTRISAVMTNAPFMLNVDCDMFANNPQIVLHAMCLLLEENTDEEKGFVQCPQMFNDGLKDDPYGNQMIILFYTLGLGTVGIQGPTYTGTGCFHWRKIIYTSCPGDTTIKGNLNDQEVGKIFGQTVELVNSASQVLSGLNEKADCTSDLSSAVKAAYEVAGCDYEYASSWGTKVGWAYGSTTEDVITGMKTHARGWKSVYCNPHPPAFLGCAPSGGPATMTQQKRWATGLLEIFFSENNPLILTLKKKLQFRQCIVFVGSTLGTKVCSRALLCCIAGVLYARQLVLPKVQEKAILIPITLFLMHNLYTLSDYFQFGMSVRAWWNNQRISRMTPSTAWLLGFLSIILKFFKLSETVFEITKKEQSSNTDVTCVDASRFTFDESPIFIPGLTLVFVHLTPLAVGVLRFIFEEDGKHDYYGEVLCSVWVVLIFSPFVKGLFMRGKYGIPSLTICISIALALGFIHLSIKQNGIYLLSLF